MRYLGIYTDMLPAQRWTFCAAFLALSLYCFLGCVLIMPQVTITLVTGAIILYSAFANVISLIDVSPPMIFITLGMIAQAIRDATFPDGIWITIPREIVLVLSEITLSIIVFHDASTINFASLHPWLPSRLLGIGLPLSVISIFYFVRAILPDVGVSGALLLAGALSPTDAGLGAAVILDPNVPSLVRQALNVESGLNDGIVTPVVFIALSSLRTASTSLDVQDVVDVAIIPIAISFALAAIITPIASFLVDWSTAKDWSTIEGRGLSVAVLPIFIYAIATITEANVFVAAFLAGGVFGYACKLHHDDHNLTAYLEAVSDFLSYTIWYLAGNFLTTAFKSGFRWQWAVVAIAVLLPLRMIPVYISLIGTDLSYRAQSFIAWFGPRGLATVVFVLIAVVELSEERSEDDLLHDEQGETFTSHELDTDLIGAPLFTVLLSVFAHGFTAVPLAKLLAKHLEHRKRSGTIEEVNTVAKYDQGEVYVRPRRGSHSTRVVLQDRSNRPRTLTRSPSLGTVRTVRPFEKDQSQRSVSNYGPPILRRGHSAPLELESGAIAADPEYESVAYSPDRLRRFAESEKLAAAKAAASAEAAEMQAARLEEEEKIKLESSKSTSNGKMNEKNVELGPRLKTTIVSSKEPVLRSNSSSSVLNSEKEEDKMDTMDI